MNITIQFREAFARKLIKLREDRKLTQREVAASVGINCKTYSAYEQRRAEPPLPVIKLLAKYYGQTLDEMVEVATTNSV